MHVLPDIEEPVMPYEYSPIEEMPTTPEQTRALLKKIRESAPGMSTKPKLPYDETVPAVNEWHQHIRDGIMDRQAQGDRIADHIDSRKAGAFVQQLIHTVMQQPDIEIDLR